LWPVLFSKHLHFRAYRKQAGAVLLIGGLAVEPFLLFSKRDVNR
jgi:hypothetical protein